MKSDPPAGLSQALAVEGPQKDLRSHRQVAILLHVEVHELGHHAAIPASKAPSGRSPIQQLQPVAKHGDGVLEGQRRDLRVDGGDLDRDDLNLRDLQRTQVQLQTPLGLGFSQEGLSQEVDVHPHPAGPASLQVPD